METEEEFSARLEYEHKAHIRRTKDYYLRKRYGITADDYDEMLTEQNGVCYICHELCPTGNNLAVDHDHDTGKVRGLLCTRCNYGIALLRNEDNLQRAINYLKEKS